LFSVSKGSLSFFEERCDRPSSIDGKSEKQSIEKKPRLVSPSFSFSPLTRIVRHHVLRVKLPASEEQRKAQGTQRKVYFFFRTLEVCRRKKVGRATGGQALMPLQKAPGVCPRPLPARETLPAELVSRFSERDKRLKGGWSRQNGKKERSDGEREKEERDVFLFVFFFFHFLSLGPLLFFLDRARERARE